MLPKSTAATCKPKDHSPLTVALAYDDDAAFCAAKDVYLGVVRSLTVEFEFRDFWWRFDALMERNLFARAVGIAAEADIVFCCPSNPHVLPRTVQDWFCHWLTRRTQPDGALVLLLPLIARTIPSQTLVERDLRETARVSGLSCFVNYYLSGHSQPSAPETPLILDRSETQQRTNGKEVMPIR
ncbi:MAG: hypothetical protein U1F83_03495 [Verrucomicrobiota bacterium]|jgi:hypothetical protein